MGQKPTKSHRSKFRADLSKILTSKAWRDVRSAAEGFESKRSRWFLKPLLTVGLSMALDDAPTMRERFAVSKEFFDEVGSKRRRSGMSVEGFLNALGAMPATVFPAMRASLQRRMTAVGIEPARVGH